MIVFPKRGKEKIAVTQRVPEIDRVHREALVGNARAAVQVPVEFLVPHERGEVHVIVEATEVLARVDGNCRVYEESSASPSSKSGAAWLCSYSSVE